MTGPNAGVELVVEQLRKQFGDHRVLAGIDLEIRCGEIVAIVGGSGCGKTVLLEHMIGQMTPDAGRVLVRDHESGELHDLATASPAEMDGIRVHWAVVFQRNALFSGSVYENIALWLEEIKRLPPAEIRAIALDALRAVGFADDAEAVLERDRDSLSGGMAKRVAVARAIAMNPTIIFYDEPTTGLDPRHASQIHELIASMHEREGPSGRLDSRTTVIITHDKDLLRRLEPRVVMLHEGRVFFDGPYAQFRSDASEIIRPYFDLMPVLQRRTRPGG